MPVYQVSFDSPAFSISTVQQYQIGLRITQGNVAFTGLTRMAFMTNTGAGPFRIEMEGFGAPPKNNPVPLPADLPVPEWSGFDPAVVTFEVATDARSVRCVPTGMAGQFTVTNRVAGFSPATIDIVVAQEALNHIGLRAVPSA